jgi:hypothetical protein
VKISLAMKIVCNFIYAFTSDASCATRKHNTRGFNKGNKMFFATHKNECIKISHNLLSLIVAMLKTQKIKIMIATMRPCKCKCGNATEK